MKNNKINLLINKIAVSQMYRHKKIKKYCENTNDIKILDVGAGNHVRTINRQKLYREHKFSFLVNFYRLGTSVLTYAVSGREKFCSK